MKKRMKLAVAASKSATERRVHEGQSIYAPVPPPA